jgi:hypothetical protein
MGEVDDGSPKVLDLVVKVSLTSLRGGPTATSWSGNRYHIRCLISILQKRESKYRMLQTFDIAIFFQKLNS